MEQRLSIDRLKPEAQRRVTSLIVTAALRRQKQEREKRQVK